MIGRLNDIGVFTVFIILDSLSTVFGAMLTYLYYYK